MSKRGAVSLTVTPTQFDFKKVDLYKWSKPLLARITNHSAKTVAVYVTATSQEFLSNGCGPLAPGASCIAHVVFAPYSLGQHVDVVAFAAENETAGAFIQVYGIGGEEKSPPE
jgi:hypothetical protein